MLDKIGIIAGKGGLPLKISEELKKNNKLIYTVAIKNFANNKEFKNVSDKVSKVKLGNLSKILNFFKENSVKKIILAGKVDHINLFRDISPDLKALKLLKQMKTKTSISFFEVVKEFFKKHKLEILRYDKILSNIIPEKGILSGHISNNIQKDIDYGFRIVKFIANEYIGQSIAVKDGVVLAVEGIEGTNKMIERSGEYLEKGDFVLLKVAGDEQDMRFDIPVIGLNTLKCLKENNGKTLAFEAGKTILLDYNKSIYYAKKNKLNLVAI